MASGGERLSESGGAIKHVLYTLQTSAVPSELGDLAAQEVIVASAYERYNFSNELTLISKYADLEKRISFRSKDKEAAVAAAAAATVAATQNKQQDGNTQTTPLQTTPVKAAAATTAAPGAAVVQGVAPVGEGAPASPVVAPVIGVLPFTSPVAPAAPMAPADASTPAAAIPAVAIASSAAVAATAIPVQKEEAETAPHPLRPPRSAPSNNDKVIDMMQRTKQSRETCIFYLESMDWNVDAAMNIFHDLTDN